MSIHTVSDLPEEFPEEPSLQQEAEAQSWSDKTAEAKRMSAPPPKGLSDVHSAPIQGEEVWKEDLALTPSHHAVLAAANTEAFQNFVHRTSPEMAEADRRSLAIGAIGRVQMEVCPKGRAPTANFLHVQLKNGYLWLEANMRYDIARMTNDPNARAWAYFFHAPLWRDTAQAKFRNRDLILDGGDVTRDPRFVAATRDVWSAIFDSMPRSERANKRGGQSHPPSHFADLLHRYARRHPHQAERGDGRRRNVISIQELLEAPDERNELVGVEGAVYSEALAAAAGGVASPGFGAEDDDPIGGRSGGELLPLTDLLEQEVDRAPPRQREVLLATIEGTRSKVVAAKRAVSVATVDNTRAQARAALLMRIVKKMGREAFWKALPDHWKTSAIAEIVDLACTTRPPGARRHRRP